ncbi:MAG: sel1 repeat family protein [Alphaproteobacteria bacterium]|nr:sel1 repeat family protein [Alphaproteobacteria bacterium]
MRLGIVALLFVALPCRAFCPFSDAFLSALNPQSSITFYNNCAVHLNDDASQAKLAALYEQGSPAVPKNMTKAIYYYQLSAENGNATSQARLAQIYMAMDKDKESRQAWYDYKKSIGFSGDPNSNEFKGDLVHPYVLLMLANEKPANKWYYSTKEVQAPVYAQQLFKTYKIDDDKKAVMISRATAWKKRKLLETANQILTQEEYAEFENTLYPKEGKADAFKRNQALKAFKEKVEAYKKQDEESAQAFH